MIYFCGILIGIINGIFASGAGQLLVFFLIYVFKIDTHKARATSIVCTSIATLVSLIGYITIASFDAKSVIIVVLASLICGKIGSKLMNKLNSNILNIISGIIIVSFSLYKMIWG